MKRILMLCLSLLLSISRLSIAGSCTGVACNNITLQKRGNCVIVVNHGTRAIGFKTIATFVSGSSVVSANSVFTPEYQMGDRSFCFNEYPYDYLANYLDNGGSSYPARGGGRTMVPGMTSIPQFSAPPPVYQPGRDSKGNREKHSRSGRVGGGSITRSERSGDEGTDYYPDGRVKSKYYVSPSGQKFRRKTCSNNDPTMPSGIGVGGPWRCWYFDPL